MTYIFSMLNWKCIVYAYFLYFFVSFLLFNSLKLGFLLCHSAGTASLEAPVTSSCKIEWTPLVPVLCLSVDSMLFLTSLRPNSLCFHDTALIWSLYFSDHPLSLSLVRDSSVHAGVPWGSLLGPLIFLWGGPVLLPGVSSIFKAAAITCLLISA